MATRHLVETVVDLIETKLKADLPAALTDIRVNRGDNLVTTEPPRDYFIYPRALAYRTPAVFIIGDRIDFQKREKGANHINANIRVNITTVIEDKDAERITIKAYRYQAAIHQVLDQVQLTTADNLQKVVVVISTATFSPLYSNMDDPAAPNAVFRKEIGLELECFAFEQL